MCSRPAALNSKTQKSLVEVRCSSVRPAPLITAHPVHRQHTVLHFIVALPLHAGSWRFGRAQHSATFVRETIAHVELLAAGAGGGGGGAAAAPDVVVPPAATAPESAATTAPAAPAARFAAAAAAAAATVAAAWAFVCFAPGVPGCARMARNQPPGPQQ